MSRVNFYPLVDRYEHTYHAVNIVNMKDGEIMFVLKAMRVAAATLIKILFKKIKLRLISSLS